MHSSGFSESLSRYYIVCNNWRLFFLEARGARIEVVNLTPGSALERLPRLDIPDDWLVPG